MYNKRQTDRIPDMQVDKITDKNTNRKQTLQYGHTD